MSKPANTNLSTFDEIETKLLFISLPIQQAQKTLYEVSEIGVWQRSDDSSDNRNRRQGIRDACWHIAGAVRQLNELKLKLPEPDEEIDAIITELSALHEKLEPLPEKINDTDAEDSSLSWVTREASEQLENLGECLRQLQAFYEILTRQQDGKVDNYINQKEK